MINDLMLLISRMEERAEMARDRGVMEPVASRISGYYAGVASGVDTVVEEIRRILEDYENDK